MRRSSGNLLVLALLVASGGCSDSTAPAEPETLEIEAGNNQNGSTGEPLPEMLRVVVTGSDGQPFTGATVRWDVVSREAQVSPATSITDNAGAASTTVTLGSSAGAVVVSATVDGLTAVSFSATAIVACDVIEPYAIGTTVTGTLSADDCRVADGSRVDRFSFTLTQTESIRFTQSSTVMNPFLGLDDAAGNPIAFHDDVSATDRSSRMRVFLAAGSYVLSPSGFATTDLGDYTLASETATDAVGGCGFFETWVTRGVQLTQELTTTDCQLTDQGGNSYHVDLYFMYLREGETLTVSQTSAALDAYIELYRLTSSALQFVTFNDDETDASGDALLTHEVAVSGVYLIAPSSSGPLEVGAYTFVVN
jgi:hypothetical protein